jgi:hypothetical protein
MTHEKYEKWQMTNGKYRSPLLFVLAAALLWSTGGLFIKWTSLSGLELSCLRSFFALLTVALFTRHEGFGLNGVTAAAAVLYAVLIILFVSATKQTTAANAIFLQYTAPVYLLILEPVVYKEKFRGRDLATVLVCVSGMGLFFVGQLRPQDVAGNLMALASGLCFALYFVGDLRQSAGGFSRGALGFRGTISRRHARPAERRLSRRGPTRHLVHAIHGRHDPRREIFRRRNHLLHRTGPESRLGLPGTRRAPLTPCSAAPSSSSPSSSTCSSTPASSAAHPSNPRMVSR